MRQIRWLPPAGWAALILTLSSVPAPAFAVSSGFPGADKLAHAGLYAILGWLSFRALVPESNGARAMLLTFVAVAAFGALDEWHQRFVPGRFPEAWDVVADACGGAVGTVAAAMRRRAKYP